jgi:branched-chain amino acid aminotransferase
MSFACLDGTVLPAGEARLPVTDPGLLRGDGVFEAVRLYDGTPFALDEHLRRMERSAANARLELDADALRADVGALVEAARPGDAIVRLLVTRGGRRIVLLEPVPEHAAAVALAVVRYAPTRILDAVKTISYGANMLASRLARERGADEALLVTPHGRILEAPTASIFVALDGRLVTPPLSDHVLDSITRRRVLAATAAVEAPLSLEDLPRATGALLASTTREAQPVCRIDDQRLDPADPLVAGAVRATRERIAQELAGSAVAS